MIKGELNFGKPISWPLTYLCIRFIASPVFSSAASLQVILVCLVCRSVILIYLCLVCLIYSTACYSDCNDRVFQFINCKISVVLDFDNYSTDWVLHLIKGSFALVNGLLMSLSLVLVIGCFLIFFYPFKYRAHWC